MTAKDLRIKGISYNIPEEINACFQLDDISTLIIYWNPERPPEYIDTELYLGIHMDRHGKEIQRHFFPTDSCLGELDKMFSAEISNSILGLIDAPMVLETTVEESDSCFDTWVEDNIKSCWIEPLWDEGVAFLKEHFNITSDINSLSDKEFGELYDKVCDIEIDEAFKAYENEKAKRAFWVNVDGEWGYCNMSEYGGIASDIVSYMGFQWRKGGRRYKS